MMVTETYVDYREFLPQKEKLLNMVASQVNESDPQTAFSLSREWRHSYCSIPGARSASTRANALQRKDLLQSTTVRRL